MIDERLFDREFRFWLRVTPPLGRARFELHPLDTVLNMTSPPHLNVFFSHSTHDPDWVTRIASQASAAGVDLYLAEHDVQVGENLSEKVTRAIEACDALIVLLSKHSLHSVYVQQEIGVAHHAGKFVIPILMEDVADQDLGILNGVEHIRLDPSDAHEALVCLSAVLSQLIDHQRREFEAQLQSQLEDEIRRHSQDMLIAGGLLLVLALIIISQAGQ